MSICLFPKDKPGQFLHRVSIDMLSITDDEVDRANEWLQKHATRHYKVRTDKNPGPMDKCNVYFEHRKTASMFAMKFHKR